MFFLFSLLAITVQISLCDGAAVKFLSLQTAAISQVSEAIAAHVHAGNVLQLLHQFIPTLKYLIHCVF